MTTRYLNLDDHDHADNGGDQAPELPVCYDEQGRPVAVVNPEYEPERPPDWLREDRLETIRRFIEVLAEHGTVTEAGQNIVTLAWLCNVRQFRTQKELADYLRVTPARAAQIVSRVGDIFPGMNRLKRRQKQRSA